jgi:hypothetical protein
MIGLLLYYVSFETNSGMYSNTESCRHTNETIPHLSVTGWNRSPVLAASYTNLLLPLFHENITLVARPCTMQLFPEHCASRASTVEVIICCRSVASREIQNVSEAILCTFYLNYLIILRQIYVGHAIKTRRNFLFPYSSMAQQVQIDNFVNIFINIKQYVKSRSQWRRWLRRTWVKGSRVRIPLDN